MAAHAKWLSLCSVLGLQDGSAQEWWEWLCSCYSEPQRCYHTMEHIESMLEQLGRHCEGKIKNLSEVLLAIFFHEWVLPLLHYLKFKYTSVIYDPKANDNEKQSADWSLTFTNELKPLKVYKFCPSCWSCLSMYMYPCIILCILYKLWKFAPDSMLLLCVLLRHCWFNTIY